MTRTAHDHYKAAIELRNKILSGQSNERPIHAWVAVVRECAKANDKFRAEMGNRVHGRSAQAFLTNLDKVWEPARAQVETLARGAA